MINTSLRPLSLPAFQVPQRATLSLPTTLETFSASPAPPSNPSTPPVAPPKTVGRVIVKTLVGAAQGAMGGLVGGTLGGVIGGLSGLGSGAGVGFSVGKAASLKLAEKTGQGKINPIAGGIGALTIPLMTGGIGALAGATAGAVCAASGQPVLGAAIGGACALVSELLS